MKIKYCKKCHLKKRIQSYDQTVKDIQEITGIQTIDQKCFSCCGLGKKNFIIDYDDELIIAKDYSKLKNLLGEKSVNS